MMNPNKIFTLTALLIACRCAIASEDPIELEVRTHQPLQSACKDLLAQAKQNLTDGKFPLVQERTTRLVSPDSSQSNGQKSNVAYEAPVGSEVASLMESRLDGRYSSVFVNCTTDEAFVAVRGGFVDATQWFGPFKIEESSLPAKSALERSVDSDLGKLNSSRKTNTK